MTYKIMIKLTYNMTGLAKELNNNTMKRVEKGFQDAYEP